MPQKYKVPIKFYQTGPKKLVQIFMGQAQNQAPSLGQPTVLCQNY